MDRSLIDSASLDSHPEVYAECLRIGRRLHKSARRVLGFLPTGPRVAVAPLMLQIGRALGDLSAATVALVDANVRYPAFGVCDAGSNGLGMQPEDGLPLLFGEQQLGERVALISPRSVESVGAGVPQLGLIIKRYRFRYAHLLVDLTGFEAAGDHLNAAALLDGVVIVAMAGSSREADVLRVTTQLPAEQTLGVVLVG